MTWEELFKPVMDAGSLSGNPVAVRSQQAEFGEAVINAFTTKTPLVAECPTGTGKSLGYLIPLIKAVSGKDNMKRGVVSTETIPLQDQIAGKDLPFLKGIYPDFTYKLLKGRTNYVCLENADSNSRANARAMAVYNQLNMRVSQLGAGERRDVERVLGRELEDNTWDFISSNNYCGENGCDTARCFSSKARAEALDADIVVVNHALLQAHIDSEFKILGDIDYVIVDEAHSLSEVLVNGWTQTISEWELTELHGSISKGLDKSQLGVTLPPALAYETEQALDSVHDTLAGILRYYQLLNPSQEWKNLSEALCEKTILGSASGQIISAMDNVERVIPAKLAKTVLTLDKVNKHLTHAVDVFIDGDIKGRRDLKKGLTATRKLKQFCELVQKALATKDGVVVDYGVPYATIVDGFERRSGEAGIRIRTVPIDISSKVVELWSMVTPVLVSATLKDLTDGTFKFLQTSLGFPPASELQTGSPFDFDAQQRTYITQADKPKVDILGAQYSFEELVELIEHAGGRSLVLFTSRKEMDDCAHRLQQLQAEGKFRWPILVQTQDVNKQKLVNEFRSINHSVLLGSKSMMTGVDFPGDTCSLVVLVKFPLPRFDALCRQQIAWWIRRGFPRWYEREALTVFQQAVGRLIRTGQDRGVVALLDQRVTDPGARVYQTARIGVDAIGSRVIRTPAELAAHLEPAA